MKSATPCATSSPQEIKPVALKPARLEPHVKPLLTDALEQASRLGLRTLALSEEVGGAGADALTRCIVTEELAAGDPDIAAVLAQTSSLAALLFDPGDDARSSATRFLTPFLQDDRYHLAFADQEPDQESALGINYHRPERGRTGIADDRPPARATSGSSTGGRIASPTRRSPSCSRCWPRPTARPARCWSRATLRD